MTIAHVVALPSKDGGGSAQHDMIVELLLEAALLPPRPGLKDVLDHVASAIDTDTLTAETAFGLGQQLRLVLGGTVADDDLESHFILMHLLSELIEVTSVVEGLHVEEIGPLLDLLATSGQVEEATRVMLLADAAAARIRVLESSLRVDLRPV